jgi:hypothetical protein
MCEVVTRSTSLLLILGLAGCGSDSAAPEDAGYVVDAVVVEAGIQFDASVDGAGFADASGADGGGALMCPIGECDPRADTPCGTGEFCTLQSAFPSCVDMIGAGAEGEPCRAVSDCAEGLACFDLGTGGECGRPCCPDELDSCPGGHSCTGAGMLIDGTASSWWRCVEPRTCDLWEPGACAPGDACYVVSETGDTECLRAGTGTVGATCAAQNDCAAGHVCTGGTPERQSCRRLCRLSAGASACPADEGYCQAYPHTPKGSGICTPETRPAYP